MQDEQVDLFEVQLGGSLVVGVQGGVEAVVGDPDLGLDEQLVPSDPRPSDRVADAAFVEIGRGGVDVPVTDLQGGLDRGGGLLRWGLVDAETQSRDVDSIVEFDLGGGHGFHGTPVGKPVGVFIGTCTGMTSHGSGDGSIV